MECDVAPWHVGVEGGIDFPEVADPSNGRTRDVGQSIRQQCVDGVNDEHKENHHGNARKGDRSQFDGHVVDWTKLCKAWEWRGESTLPG